MKLKLMGVIALISFFAVAIPAVAFGADSPSSANSGGPGLTISPPLNEVRVDQGKSVTQSVKITNPTNSMLEIYPVVMDFTSRDDSGDPKFLKPEENKSSKYSLSSWIQYTQDKIVLEPLQIVDWEYRIAVPSNGGPGGHYGAILFSNKPPEVDKTQTAVGISSMVAHLILATVSGQTTEQAVVSDFSTNKGFYFNPPVDLKTVITNKGNVHISPKGDIKISNMFGKSVSQLELNGISGRILPDGSRKFTNSWNPSTKPFWKAPIGRYSAELVAVYGQSGSNLSAKLSFWVIPLWFIITVAVVLVLLITIIIIARKHRKKKALAKQQAAVSNNAPIANSTSIASNTPLISNPPAQPVNNTPPAANYPRANGVSSDIKPPSA